MLEQIELLLAASSSFSTANKKLKVQGVIFDSAPCYLHFSSGARAIGEGKPMVLKILLVAAFSISVSLSYLCNPWWRHNFWRSMTRLEHMGDASLYLYSKNDPLCDAEKLDALIAARRAVAGSGDVRSHCWTTSSHVGHLRDHNGQYRELVYRFLQDTSRG